MTLSWTSSKFRVKVSPGTSPKIFEIFFLINPLKCYINKHVKLNLFHYILISIKIIKLILDHVNRTILLFLKRLIIHLNPIRNLSIKEFHQLMLPQKKLALITKSKTAGIIFKVPTSKYQFLKGEENSYPLHGIFSLESVMSSKVHINLHCVWIHTDIISLSQITTRC